VKLLETLEIRVLKRLASAVQLRPWPPSFQLLTSVLNPKVVPICSNNSAGLSAFASLANGQDDTDGDNLQKRRKSVGNRRGINHSCYFDRARARRLYRDQRGRNMTTFTFPSSGSLAQQLNSAKMPSWIAEFVRSPHSLPPDPGPGEDRISLTLPGEQAQSLKQMKKSPIVTTKSDGDNDGGYEELLETIEAATWANFRAGFRTMAVR
jgi:hypothetical protein